MKKAVALLAVFVLLWGIAMPADAWARGWGHRHHGGWGWFWPGALVGGLVAGAAIAATAPFAFAAPPPVVVSPPPVYVQPAPVYAAPPPAYSAPTVSAAPPVQREVVYPHGKYVLYGDGVSQPWQWVWVAAPPSSPPPPPPR